MNRKQKRKVNKTLIAIISVVAIVIIAVGGYFILNLSKPSANKPPVHISNNPMGYSMRNNMTPYQKEIFDELEALSEKGVSQELAESLAKNYIADFYTWSNKSIKNDIGGAQFFEENYRLNFRDSAINTYYRNLETYLHDYGQANLPEVIDVQIVSIKENKQYTNLTYDLELKWTYKENLTFPIKDISNAGYVSITANDDNTRLNIFYVEAKN